MKVSPVLCQSVVASAALIVVAYLAVNFGQYDYSGIVLNRSPMIRRRLPDEGSHAYKVSRKTPRSASQTQVLLSCTVHSVSLALQLRFASSCASSDANNVLDILELHR